MPRVDALPLIETLIARLLEKGILDQEDCLQMASELDAADLSDDAHIMRCLVLEHATKDMSIADLRRSEFRIVKPSPDG